MTIATHVYALEQVILNAEFCLERFQFKEFLHDVRDSCARRLSSLEINKGLSFLKFSDEE